MAWATPLLSHHQGEGIAFDHDGQKHFLAPRVNAPDIAAGPIGRFFGIHGSLAPSLLIGQWMSCLPGKHLRKGQSAVDRAFNRYLSDPIVRKPIFSSESATERPLTQPETDLQAGAIPTREGLPSTPPATESPRKAGSLPPLAERIRQWRRVEGAGGGVVRLI